MIAVSINHIESIIKEFDVEINQQVSAAIYNLEELRDNGKLRKEEKDYINKILNSNVNNIVFAKPDQFENYIQSIGIVPKSKKKLRGRAKSLSEKIIIKLGYPKYRELFYPKFFKRIGIKACVYCNSQLTVSFDAPKFVNKKKVKKNTKKTIISKAKHQVDHYIPKADYPFLCISLYNLYPVCASCNNSKKENRILFELYSNDVNKIHKSDFEFQFEDGSVSDFLLSRNIDDIKFTFIEPDVTEEFYKFKELFDIEGIYETQKDVAEELILKSEIYKDSYKETLIDSFPDIFTHSSISNRILIGNYVEPENIHKRPMSKFMQDLARQLNLDIIIP
jgi:hypothetical protein